MIHEILKATYLKPMEMSTPGEGEMLHITDSCRSLLIEAILMYGWAQSASPGTYYIIFPLYSSLLLIQIQLDIYVS